MSKRLHITAASAAVSIASAIRVAAEAAPLLVITGQAFDDLGAELGGEEAAATFLLALAEEIGHPLGLNVPTDSATSSTAFIPPRGWSTERVAGWVAGRHQELERQFGVVSRVGPDLSAGGQR